VGVCGGVSRVVSSKIHKPMKTKLILKWCVIPFMLAAVFAGPLFVSLSWRLFWWNYFLAEKIAVKFGEF